VTDERDEEHVRQIANAIREELDENEDPAALARFAGAALGDQEAQAEPASPDDTDASPPEIPPTR
jgi:hypothetical protein